MTDFKIKLSKRSKIHQNIFALVSEEDKDLDSFRWHVASSGAYGARKTPDSKHVLMHRVILARKLGRELGEGELVDHINRNGLDNRRENLRLATNSQNIMNSVRKQKVSKSGYKGVYYKPERNKYKATITVKKKHIHLGYFDTKEEAYEAYCKAADELHGEFANYEKAS
jgi:hypothetical protein